jgi:hypothetical protein
MLQVNIPVIQTSNSKAQGAIANHCDLATSDHELEEISKRLARKDVETHYPEILYRLAGLEIQKMKKLA